MKKIVLYIIILTSVSSCANTWNEDDKDAWKQACKETAMHWAGSEGKAKTYCDCVLGQMIKKYPNENDALEHINELATDTSLSNCKTKELEAPGK